MSSSWTPLTKGSMFDFAVGSRAANPWTPWGMPASGLGTAGGIWRLTLETALSLHLGGFRWKPCWVWQPLPPQRPRAKGLDLSRPSPEQSLHQRRGESGKRSLPPLDPPQKKAERKMVRTFFFFFLLSFAKLISHINQSPLSLCSLGACCGLCSFLELNPSVPFASRFLNTRTMKETFKSFVELLISVALDEDLVTALERANGEWNDFRVSGLLALKSNIEIEEGKAAAFRYLNAYFAGLPADELLLPHMKRVEGMITDNRKRLLHKLHIGQVLKVCVCLQWNPSVIDLCHGYVSSCPRSTQTALDNFPEISVVTELKKDGESPAFKVRLSGKAYNKKTMKPYKMPNKVPQVRQGSLSFRQMSSRGG